MKALKMQLQKSSRWLVIVLATVVLILTSIVVADATQTITTPNAAFIPYNLAPGATSAPITPAASKSVLVMGCCTSAGDQSVGQATLFHIPSGGMVFFSLQYGATTVYFGKSSTAGDYIVSIDKNIYVDIEVASADTIRVHNTSPGTTLAGNVTLIW